MNLFEKSIVFVTAIVAACFILFLAERTERDARETELYRAWVSVHRRVDIPFETWRTLYRNDLLPVVPGTIPIIMPGPSVNAPIPMQP